MKSGNRGKKLEWPKWRLEMGFSMCLTSGDERRLAFKQDHYHSRWLMREEGAVTAGGGEKYKNVGHGILGARQTQLLGHNGLDG